MSDEQIQKLLQGAVRAAKSGQKDLARRAFLQVTRLQPENEAGWLGLATSASDRAEQLSALRRVLEINPNNAQAAAAVQRLGYSVEELLAVDEYEEAAASVRATAAEQVEETTDTEDDTDTFDESGEDDAAPDEDAFSGVFTDTPAPPDSDEDDEFVEQLPEWMRDREATDTDIGEVPDWMQTKAGYETPSWLEGMDEEDNEPIDADSDEPTSLPGEDAATPMAGMRLRQELDTPYDDDDIEDPPLPGDEWVDETTDDIEEPPFDDDYDEDEIAPPVDETGEAIEEPAAAEELLSVQELLDRRRPPAQGNGGVPYIAPDEAARAADTSEQAIMAYLNERVSEISPDRWVRKRRGRAGEGAIWVLRFQVAAILLVIGGILAYGAYQAAVNIPEISRVVFAATATITPSPTLTPSSTPGITPTPSSTPEQTYTPSPTLNPSVTPGSTGTPPTSTPPFVSFGNAERRILDANELIEAGEYDQALELLQEEERTTRGNFTPFYYIALVHTLQGNFDQARSEIERGVEEWQNLAADALYDPMVNVANARVNIAEARELGAGAERSELLSTAREQLQDAIDLRPDFIDAYLLMVESYRMQGDDETALEVLDEAINRDLSGSDFQDFSLYTNGSLRLERARILYDQGEYDEALHELDVLLKLEPFMREALRLRVQIGLDRNRPGDAVLAAEDYLFRYPDSVEGFKLLGDAHAAERKGDLALIDYSNALEGDPEDPAYAQVLISRGNLYFRERNYEQAFEDYSAALQLVDSDEIRARRLQSALAINRFDTVLADANELDGKGLLPQGELDYLRARVLIEDEGDYEQALGLLRSAIENGVPSGEFGRASEYLAQALVEAEQYTEALTAINDAIASTETGSRYYLKGQILEAIAAGQEPEQAADTLEQARDAYTFVMTWGTVFPYSFTEDARDRYMRLAQVIDSLREEAAAEDTT